MLALSFLKSQFALIAGSLYVSVAPMEAKDEVFELKQEATAETDLEALKAEIEKLEAQQQLQLEELKKARPEEK